MVGSPAHIDALRRSLEAAGDGPVELLETHISSVLLTRELAYKFKKPVTLPFLDYGTIDARRRCCEEELRINRRLAPALYLGLSAVTGTADAPQLDGDGPLLDWAVRMRRFPHGALMGERLAAGLLTAQDIDRLAATLARFHQAAPVASDPAFGHPGLRRAAALEAAESLDPQRVGLPLLAWLRGEAEALAPLWAARHSSGRVREGHGDLHLDNLLVLDGEATAFDAIEFNPGLRWIDVIDDIAFAAMDLMAHGRSDLAWRFAGAWFDATGDHEGVPTLRFSMVYRALVRARVAALRGGSGEVVARYVATAQQIAQPANARLLVTHGLPGSGKTHLSQHLLEAAGAVRLRSDVERARLFGRGAYGAAQSKQTYDRLLALAACALRAGQPVIVDAAFLRQAERQRAAALARDLGVPFTILHCHADPRVLEERVVARLLRGHDESEADVAVLRQLTLSTEPLVDAERACTVAVDTGGDVDMTAIANAWRSAAR